MRDEPVSRLTHGQAVMAGVASYILGLAAKALLHSALSAVGLGTLPPPAHAAIVGVLSALAELGAAALFLRSLRFSLGDAVAFGAGIGVFELLFVLLLGWIDVSEALGAPASPGALAAGLGPLFLLERGMTLIGHAASRTLIYIALRERAWAPAVLTFLVFSLVDGAAQYGELARWDWESSTVLLRYHAFNGALTAAEACAAWILARRHVYRCRRAGTP